MFSSHTNSTLSLFSSIGTHPLGLFASQVDASLPDDSHITVIPDVVTPPESNIGAIYLRTPDRGGTILHPVLNIQSPTSASTYIHSLPNLGITLQWMHLQVRNLGKPWSFEFGIVDPTGREGVIRCSTFQQEARLYPTTPPLLHIPLVFPPLPPLQHEDDVSGNTTETAWSTISLHIPSFIPHFSSSSLLQPIFTSSSSPHGGYPTRFASVSYVQIYASCRLRRIWFSESKPSEGTGAWELELYGAAKE